MTVDLSLLQPMRYPGLLYQCIIDICYVTLQMNLLSMYLNTYYIFIIFFCLNTVFNGFITTNS